MAKPSLSNKQSMSAGISDDRSILRITGLALPAAVLVLGLASPPREGLTLAYVTTFTGLLAALVVVDQAAPSQQTSVWRRLLWLAAELALSFFIVRAHGTLVRPALIYILPTSRALLLFGPRGGLALSLSVWLVYGMNVGLYAWPDRLNEYPNYLTFFLAPYAIAVALTLAVLRQAANRHHIQALYDELRAAHAELQELHKQTRETAVVQERNRIAREIHDSVAHYLTVVNVQLEAAEKLAQDKPDRALEQVRRARRLTVICLQEVRRSVAALRASSLEDLSLPRALRKLATEFAESTGIIVDVTIAAPDDVRLAPETALALYRAAQEGLTNVQKHAHAKKVRMNMALGNDSVRLSVQDDGLGPSESSGTQGFGLLGLRERVELLGGQLDFGRGDAGGYRLAVTIPSTGGA